MNLIQTNTNVEDDDSEDILNYFKPAKITPRTPASSLHDQEEVEVEVSDVDIDDYFKPAKITQRTSASEDKTDFDQTTSKSETSDETSPWWKIPALILGRAIPSGFAGSLGDIANILSLITQNQENYSKYKKEMKEKGTPGAQARNVREFKALDVLEKPPRERSWSETQAALADLMSDDDIYGTPFFLPDTQDTTEFVDKLTEDKLKPTTPLQEILSRGGEFLGGSLYPATGLPTKLSALGASTAGLAYETAIQSGASPLAALAISLGAGFTAPAAPAAVKLGSSTAKTASQLIKNPKETIAKTLSSKYFKKAQTPSEIAARESLVQSAKELGIPLPASAVTDSNVIKLIETQLSESGLAGKELEKLRKSVTDAFARNIDESLESLSKTTFESSSELGHHVKDSLVQSKDAAKTSYKNLYDEATSLIPETAKVPAKNLKTTLNKLIKDMSHTYKPSAEKKAAINFLKSFRKELNKNEEKVIDKLISKSNAYLAPTKNRKELVDFLEKAKEEARPFDKAFLEELEKVSEPLSINRQFKPELENFKKEVLLNKKNQGASVQKLVNQKKDLHESLDFEALGGSKKRLNELSNAINEDIAQYASENPAFYRQYKKADKEFSEYAKAFIENQFVRNAIKSQDPEQLVSFVNRKHKREAVSDALKYLGKEKVAEINNAASRHAFQEMLNKNIYQSKSGELSVTKLSSFLNAPKNKEKIINVVGNEQYKKLQKLAQVAHGIDRGASKFMNPSKSGARATDVLIGGFVISQLIKAVVTFNPMFLISAGLGAKGPKLLESILTDPAFIEELTKASKAGLSQSKEKEFLNSVQKLLLDISAKSI